MFDLGRPVRRRRPSLTPMIDVVFLLLVFFMLAARFGTQGAVPLVVGAGVGSYSGPPRLVEVTPDALRLNGLPVADLAAALRPLMQGPDDIIVLRGRGGADVQRLVDALTLLQAAGFAQIAVVP